MKRVAIIATLFLTRLAFADQPLDRPEAFEVDRDRPPPGQAELGFDAGGSIMSTESGRDGMWAGAWAVSAQISYLDEPFRLYTRQVEVFPVEHRETLALGGAYAVTPTLLVDARMPFIHQVGNRFVGLGDNTKLDHFVLGDLALGGRIRLATREHAQLFARGELTLPTGDDHDFAGEARYTAAWMLIARFTLPTGFVIAATAGVRFRPREVTIANRLLGDELMGAVGITYELPGLRGLWCPTNHVRATAELLGVLGNDVAGQRGPSPVETRVGMVSEIRTWLAVAGRVGMGLDDEIGSPRFRGLVEVVYRH
ncbi:MAG TPA: hypothetical protein VL326_00650 [Kofleriaceae bacterium]|nr:hypothetical protein [Kofleriaceae bacterium]